MEIDKGYLVEAWQDEEEAMSRSGITRRVVYTQSSSVQVCDGPIRDSGVLGGDPDHPASACLRLCRSRLRELSSPSNHCRSRGGLPFHQAFLESDQVPFLGRVGSGGSRKGWQRDGS